MQNIVEMKTLLLNMENHVAAIAAEAWQQNKN